MYTNNKWCAYELNSNFNKTSNLFKTLRLETRELQLSRMPTSNINILC